VMSMCAWTPTSICRTLAVNTNTGEIDGPLGTEHVVKTTNRYKSSKAFHVLVVNASGAI
jgi:hypothetical protein